MARRRQIVLVLATAGLGLVALCVAARIALHRMDEECVVEGTLVSTPTGARPVENLRAGDEVIGFDAAGAVPVVRRVRRVHRGEARSWIRCVFDDGAVLEATSNHRIFDPETRRYVPLGEAPRLARWNRATLEDAVAFRRFEIDGAVTVFDVELESAPHNYLANGVLVHNKTMKISPESVPPPDATDE